MHCEEKGCKPLWDVFSVITFQKRWMLGASSKRSYMSVTLGHRLSPPWSRAGSPALYPATEAANSSRSLIHPSMTNNGFQRLLRQDRILKQQKQDNTQLDYISREWRWSILLLQSCSLCVCGCIHTGLGVANMSTLTPVQRQEISLHSELSTNPLMVTLAAKDQKNPMLLQPQLYVTYQT